MDKHRWSLDDVCLRCGCERYMTTVGVRGGSVWFYRDRNGKNLHDRRPRCREKAKNEKEKLIEKAVIHLRDLRDFYFDDMENRHIEGDKILCEVLRELGGAEVAEVYEEVSKGWFHS